ncbi:threonine-phosphate decarboxylase CobD [Neobacillus sp. 3P2-tot-E-2]|uniref:threonine-phosphate decarboxylase CobD n=1 Tax=Neobacillus sp. 3P2-tot-E-2 TaxID=3132212 RepID=UPI0039A0A7CC
MNLPSHGSNPQHLFKSLGLSLPEKYIDFSANINPLGPPPALKEKWNDFYREITVYPDPFAEKLRKKIADKEQISAQSILIGNGGAELITLVARFLSGKKVVVVEPSFSEYEKAGRANDCEIQYHQLLEPHFELSMEQILPSLTNAGALFLCNPNNPTGIQYSVSTVISIIQECEKQNCFVVLDEAFYDFLVNYESYIPYINKFSNLIIIRSMTKMFAIPGLRLGYLAAAPALIAEISRLQPHWSINSIALLAGELCLQNEEYIKETQVYISEERERLSTFFKRNNFVMTSSQVNFYLLRDSNQKEQNKLFEFLLLKGIIPRHTFNFPGLEGNWLRFAIKSKDENSKLMEVLLEWRQLH